MQENPQPIGFQLVKITTEQFAIIDEGVLNDGTGISLSTELKFKGDTGKNLIGVFSSFKFVVGETPFIVIEAACHFQIEKNSWDLFLNPESKKIKVPMDFMGHLSMLTVGTTRGILHAKTENTPYNVYVLPTINVAELVKEDVIFE